MVGAGSLGAVAWQGHINRVATPDTYGFTVFQDHLDPLLVLGPSPARGGACHYLVFVMRMRLMDSWG